MPLGSPAIIGPVSTCSRHVRVMSRFTGSLVRIFLQGDPVPLDEMTVTWSDTVVPIDQTRLVANRTIVATQTLAGETSERSPTGVIFEPALNGPVTLPYTAFACAQSLFVSNCSRGARVEVWQGGTLLGADEAVGDQVWITFGAGRRVAPGSALDAADHLHEPCRRQHCQRIADTTTDTLCPPAASAVRYDTAGRMSAARADRQHRRWCYRPFDTRWRGRLGWFGSSSGHQLYRVCRPVSGAKKTKRQPRHYSS